MTRNAHVPLTIVHTPVSTCLLYPHQSPPTYKDMIPCSVFRMCYRISPRPPLCAHIRASVWDMSWEIVLMPRKKSMNQGSNHHLYILLTDQLPGILVPLGAPHPAATTIPPVTVNDPTENTHFIPVWQFREPFHQSTSHTLHFLSLLQWFQWQEYRPLH